MMLTEHDHMLSIAGGFAAYGSRRYENIKRRKGRNGGDGDLSRVVMEQATTKKMEKVNISASD